MIAGIFSNVFTKLGFIASFKSAITDPVIFKSFTYTYPPLTFLDIIILSTLFLKSSISFDIHNIAIISVATVIIKLSSLVFSFFRVCAIVTFLKALSFISIALLKYILFISIP